MATVYCLNCKRLTNYKAWDTRLLFKSGHHIVDNKEYPVIVCYVKEGSFEHLARHLCDTNIAVPCEQYQEETRTETSAARSS